MIASLDFLREFNFWTVLFRLILAAVLGGLLGLEREIKGRPAGLRTHMILCVGATMTVLLSYYDVNRLAFYIADNAAADPSLKVDVSRFAAQVMSGIGFLGAGSILIRRRLEIQGLTTATGLLGVACVGIAVGAGFYEAVLVAYGMMFIVNRFFSILSNWVVRRSRSMSIYLEFEHVKDIPVILRYFAKHGWRIVTSEMDAGNRKQGETPHATFHIVLEQHPDHEEVLLELSTLDCVLLVDEI